MKKFFKNAIIICLTVVLAAFLFACNDKTDEPKKDDGTDTKITYTVFVGGADQTVTSQLKVKLVSNGTDVTEETALTNGKAEFSLEAGVYDVVIVGVPADYTASTAKLTPTSKQATITLTKKGGEAIDTKVTYKITVQYPDGTAVAEAQVQLCSVEGTCYLPKTVDENGVATIELDAGTYVVHLYSDCPAGYTFDDNKYQVTAQNREIVVKLDVAAE